MAGCCAAGYGTVFDARQARRDARRYRRRGLSKAARQLVRLAAPDGGTVLEIGGGVGAIQIELLKAGAERATNVELSPGYEEEAARLLGEAGLTERVERRVTDFVEAADSVEPADVVVMHRVVCCYPDPERLVGAAAAHARRRLVLTYPPDNLLSRLVTTGFNVWCAARRVDFRSYVHPPHVVLAAARAHGLEPRVEGRTAVWRYVALEHG